MFETVREWLRLRLDAERLHNLDNRLLADMGFEREFIDVSVTTGVKMTSRLVADLREGAELSAQDEAVTPSDCGPYLAQYASAGR
jgi:hypothetical protein